MMTEKAGKHFPDMVKTLLPLLSSVDHVDVVIHQFKEERSTDGALTATKYPKPVLALLDRVVPASSAVPPYDLGTILNMIADAAPQLRQDPRWRRLSGIANPK